MNETGTGFEVKHVRQVMDVMLGFLNLHLGVRECFPLLSGLSTLQLNVFQIRSTIILYQIHFHFYFYISFLNPPGIRER